jgi:hypothetical protein
MAANVAGMWNEVKRYGRGQNARATRDGTSGINIPWFCGLIILRVLRLAFSKRQRPCDHHNGEHEKKCRAGHFFKHRPVSLIFIKIAE